MSEKKGKFQKSKANQNLFYSSQEIALFQSTHLHLNSSHTPQPELENLPLVSCIMPTHNRRPFISQAIQYFRRQDYPNRELIIVDDGTDPIQDLVPEDSRIRYLREDYGITIGAARNLAINEARGEIIVHWDDDDWMANWRLSYQVAGLLEQKADICGLDKIFYYKPETGQSWQFVNYQRNIPWVAGNTLCYTKNFWRINPFQDINVGEDIRFIWNNRFKKVAALQDNTFLIALIHEGNISRKLTTDFQWHDYPVGAIQDLMGEDHNFYIDLFL